MHACMCVRTAMCVLCCAVLCCAVLCCAVLCCAVLCCVLERNRLAPSRKRNTRNYAKHMASLAQTKPKPHVAMMYWQYTVSLYEVLQGSAKQKRSYTVTPGIPAEHVTMPAAAALSGCNARTHAGTCSAPADSAAVAARVQLQGWLRPSNGVATARMQCLPGRSMQHAACC
jgi:hypothetical protein